MSDSNIPTCISPCSDVTANISYATGSTSNHFTVLSDEARATAPSMAHRTSDHPDATAELLSSRVAGMTKGSNSDVIAVAGGTNNISEHSSSQHIQAIRKLVDSLAEINPRSEIIISKIPHRFDNAKLNPKVDSVNGYIRRICNSNHRCHSLIHDYNINDYTADDFHMNASGKTKYAHEIRHFTMELLYGNNV